MLIKSLIRDARTLAVGAGTGQIIALLATPLITRIYSPEDLGTFQVFSVGVMLLMPFVHLSLHKGIPIASNEQQSKALVLLSFCCLILSSIFLLIFGIIIGINTCSFYFEPIFSNWYFFVLVLLLGGGFEIISSMLLRHHKFGEISTNSILQSSVNTFSKIALGGLVGGGIALILSSILSTLSGVIKVIVTLPELFAFTKNDIKLTNLKLELIRSVAFARFYAPTTSLGSFTFWFPVFFGALLFGEITGGHFALAFMVLVLPISLIGNSLHQSFYSRLLNLSKAGFTETSNILLKIQSAILVVCFPFCLVLLVFGSQIFSVLFGVSWALSGTYAGYLGVLTIALLCINPFSKSFFLFCGEQRKLFLISLLRLIVSIALAAFVQYEVLNTPIQFLVSFVVCSMLLGLLEHFQALRLYKNFLVDNSHL